MADDPLSNNDYASRDYQDKVDANDAQKDRFTEDATSDLHGVVGIPADELEADLNREARQLDHPTQMEDDDTLAEVEELDEEGNVHQK